MQLSAWGVFFALFVLWGAGRSRALCFIGWLGMAAGFAHAGVRGFLEYVYDANPTSSMVLEALANTNGREAREFFQNAAGDVLTWCAFTAFFLIASFLIAFFLVPRGCALRLKPSGEIGGSNFSAFLKRLPKAAVLLTVLFTLVFGTAAAVKSWRVKLPVFQWVKVSHEVTKLQASWKEQKAQRAREWQAAVDLVRTAENSSVNTIVLVIGESTNRDNMSLYGYGRPTTPNLASSVRQGGVFYAKEAWSVKPSTVASFESMFTFAVKDRKGGDQIGNMFAFFKAAGWRITWISNQDDIAIKSNFSWWADRIVSLNAEEGRSSDSLDIRVIDPLTKALREKSGKNLIVVHLIGIHPHYQLRYPSGWRAAWSEDDKVKQDMLGQGRSMRTRVSRDQYDLAMLYQDRIVSETLDLTKSSPDASKSVWIYLSDHGLETGGTVDRTGHSPTTLSGYKIPFLLWVGDEEKRREIEADADRLQFFRADWLDELLLDVAGIRYPSDNPTFSIYNRGYRYQEPGVIREIKARKALEAAGK
jgi:heptose-I-phosphate ethanolaminephosphotransferase